MRIQLPPEEIRKMLVKAALQSQVFELLSDRNWHCRKCEGNEIASDQYAGGGGIQGLQRGNRTQPGLVIESENRFCLRCQVRTRNDRWTGEVKEANAPANISAKLVERILAVYSFTDVIECRERERDQLVIDHRFPMERWGGVEPRHNVNMFENEIRRKFQLLKKDIDGNHNLLKSRSCERCIRTGKRGAPLGIKFWYVGDENWGANIPSVGTEAEQGCVGCGWYDFDTWRNSLNAKLADPR